VNTMYRQNRTRPTAKASLWLPLLFSLLLSACNGSADPANEIEPTTDDLAATSAEPDSPFAPVSAPDPDTPTEPAPEPPLNPFPVPDPPLQEPAPDLLAEPVLLLDPVPTDEPAPDSLAEPVPDAEQIALLTPVVRLAEDQSILIGETISLQGTVMLDGIPVLVPAVHWESLSGPGAVMFTPPDKPATEIKVDMAGQYILKMTAFNGSYFGFDTIVLSAIDAPVNSPPLVDTGVDTAPGSDDEIPASRNWSLVNTNNGSKPAARHEAGGVGYQNQFYMLGGRGKRPVNRYDPVSNRWENLGTPAKEMHHFQPVVYNGKIYVVGALACCFPEESVIDRIQIFDPATKKWSQGAKIPGNRKRGAAGVVVYNNKIYMVGGSTNGHDGGAVNWFDEYNPANNSWKTLKNAPTKRDHFGATVVGHRLVVAGGRQTDYPDTFSNLVGRVDVYNFATGQWESGIPSIPTQRAGAVVVTQGDEALVIGGETKKAGAALKVVEAYNVKTRKWRTLKPIKRSRHSGGIAKLDAAIHIASGNSKRGGGDEITSHEKISIVD